jgi:hypothetical protein
VPLRRVTGRVGVASPSDIEGALERRDLALEAYLLDLEGT